MVDESRGHSLDGGQAARASNVVPTRDHANNHIKRTKIRYKKMTKMKMMMKTTPETTEPHQRAETDITIGADR